MFYCLMLGKYFTNINNLKIQKWSNQCSFPKKRDNFWKLKKAHTCLPSSMFMKPPLRGIADKEWVTFEDITSATASLLGKVKTQWWALEEEGWEELITPSCGSGEGQGSSPRLEVYALLSSICAHNSYPPPCTSVLQDLTRSGLWQDKIPGFRILGIFQNLFTPWRQQMSLLLPQNLHGRAAN